MVSFSARDNTEVLRITATTDDPYLSAQICNKYADIAPGVIQDIINGGSVKVLGEAKPNGNPSAPNIELYTIAGFAAGFCGAAIFYIHTTKV
jgi:capsular polysaccharide biosynthesis protein